MGSRWPRLTARSNGLGRALAFLLASCGLAACVAQPSAPGYGAGGAVVAAGVTQPAIAAPTGRRVALLLPLSGANAQLGQSMLLAAKLAFEPGGPANAFARQDTNANANAFARQDTNANANAFARQDTNANANAFDTQDTKGTADGAAAAARAASAAGAGIFVGPLTASEATAVTPVARAGNIPVLAFTSDPSKAQPGVWALGLTPAQQVRTLVRAAAASDKRRIGAILQSNPFGDSLASGLVAATFEAGLPPPTILRYDAQTGLTDAITQLGNSGGAPGVPPAIDALLLGTSAEVTLRILPQLVAAGLGPDRVRLLGTAIWGRDAAKLAPLAGAWFAGPPAATLKVFEDNYTAHYSTPPRDIASIAFDAAAAARAASTPAGIDVAILLNPSGFAGANGVFRLLPDGTVRRSLALFEIGAGGLQSRELPPEGATPPSI